MKKEVQMRRGTIIQTHKEGQKLVQCNRNNKNGAKGQTQALQLQSLCYQPVPQLVLLKKEGNIKESPSWSERTGNESFRGLVLGSIKATCPQHQDHPGETQNFPAMPDQDTVNFSVKKKKVPPLIKRNQVGFFT